MKKLFLFLALLGMVCPAFAQNPNRVALKGIIKDTSGVEMPFATDETVNLQLEVPHGYMVDELPRSIIVKLNEQEDGLFEYRISQSGDNVSLRSRVRFKRTFFMPEEYETLREFFNLIVKKQAEQVVFKKKK